MFTFLNLLLALTSLEVTSAEPLSAEAIYRRCYIKFVRSVPNESDPLLNSTRSGSLSGVDGCRQLLERASWNANGILIRRQDKEARSIVRTINELHRSWFSVDTAPFASAHLIHDMEEPALFFTRTVFMPDTPVRAALTHPTGIMGVRDQEGYPEEIGNFLAQNFFRYLSDFPYSESNDFHLSVNVPTYDPVRGAVGPFQLQKVEVPSRDLVEVGALVGVKDSTPITLPAALYASVVNSELRHAVGVNMRNHNLRAHYGGGVLGSQPFFIKNANLGPFTVPVDYDQINRRLTAKIFEDLLCHQLPTLSDADVASEVVPTSVHGFQKSTSCMRCHSSIDKAGFGYRNLVLFNTSGPPNRINQTMGVPSFAVGRLPQVAGAQHFALKPPTGVLHYRDLLTGTQRRANFSNLTQLGTLLTNQNDFYLCATKRYYRFLTGVNVDVTQVATDPRDLVHQKRIRAMASQLKVHQSVRQLLVDIIASPAFQNTSVTPEVE